jgi:hypothetical protein
MYVMLAALFNVKFYHKLVLLSRLLAVTFTEENVC